MANMHTSLAEQLRRLKTPQTSLFIDTKKRASILFDAKEAATKDRETIFDIGYSGFKELIALNPSFMQFESSLFDKNARELQRAVESREVNQQLNEVIKKFLIHLSPYLLLQPAHKCLEWLIRRFQINEYNKDEMMMLMLPYHETKIFVICLQTMRLNDLNDKWHWLKSIQSPGVPLSKQALLNRAASDTGFLQFVCQSIVYAVEELETKSNTLQVYYAFFCTTVIGALDTAKINESHVSHIYAATRKGLKSNSIDFCAASLMIIGQLVNKTKLQSKILNKIVGQLLKVGHAKLQPDVIILLVLIYRNQNETIQEIPDDYLVDLVHFKWIPSVLAQIYSEGINTLPFYLPLLAACLRKVQLKGDNWRVARKFCDALLQECFFHGPDQESVIRCTFNSFILKEKPEESVITVESDNENDVNMESSDDDKHITQWYTSKLKDLERRYSTTFDVMVKEIMRSDCKSMGELKKKSLKNVLSFLFKIVCTDDNSNLFEKLYHYNARYRIEAIKYLVRNFDQMSFSDDSKSLLKDSIAERITDESPLVVYEALQFESAQLVKIIGKDELKKKLITILEKTQEKPSIWEKAGLAALKHLVSNRIYTKEISVDILVAVMPFILQQSSLGIEFAYEVLDSPLATTVKFLKGSKETIGPNTSKDAIFDRLSEGFESRKGLPTTAHILKYIKSVEDSDLTLTKAFYSMLLLTYSLNKHLTAEIATEVLEVMSRYEKHFGPTYIEDQKKWFLQVAMGSYPVNLNVMAIKNIIEFVSFSHVTNKRIDFVKPLIMSKLLHEIVVRITAGMLKRDSKKQSQLFADAMQFVFEKLFKPYTKRIDFMSNYFTIDLLKDENEIAMDEELQVHLIKYFNSILETDTHFHSAQIELQPFIHILSGLRSVNAAVREASYETLTVLSKFNITGKDNKYATLIGKLLKRENELQMDENQLPLILYTIFKKKSSNELAANLTEFVEFIASTKNNNFLVALLLEALTHVNTEIILKSVTPIALNILTASSEEMAKSEKKILILNAFESAIVQNILSRITPQTIQLVKKEPAVWQLLHKSIELHGIHLNTKSKQISVACATIAIMDNDLFNELTHPHQRQFIGATVSSATYAENVELVLLIGKFVKQIHINAKNCLPILDEMAKTDRAEPMEIDGELPARQRRNSLNISDSARTSADLLKSKSWKCGITWLELLQNKQNISDGHLLIPSLFAILQKCLQFEDQSGVEYAKQLVLSCIHHMCVTIAPNGESNKNLISEKSLKIEPVVQCIRGTQNPQTHHHALQLLSHLARLLPDQVLHNMMDIFTFMGSSVVRHDDAYSFQIITNVISAIVPTLTRINENKSEAEKNELVVPVLKVFSDIILDVPEHRRLPLYKKLLDTLGGSQYLWMFLVILVESHISHLPAEGEKQNRRQITATNVELPQRVDIALGLTKEFDCETIIVTASNLIQFMHKLPTAKPTNEEEASVARDVLILFNINSCTKRQFRHFKYELLKFIATLTSSVEFVNKVALLSDDDTKIMKPHYKNAIIHVLTLIPDVSKATEQPTESAHSDYWKALLHNCFEVLDNIISLLSSNTLLVVVQGLLLHKLSSVRRRVIELLINKIQFNSDMFTQENEESLVALLDPLTDIIESIVDEKKNASSASIAENLSTQQMALMAVKLLSKHLADKHPKQFKSIVETLIDILRKNEKVPRILLATGVLCLSEICSNLRVHSIAYLHSFMKIFIEILKQQITVAASANDNVLICSVTGLQKIVGTLPLYLSPYLVELIVTLSQVWHNLEKEPARDPKRVATIIDRMNGIWDKLSSTLELRVLVPIFDQSYKRLLNDEQDIGFGPLMQLITQTFHHQSSSNISAFMPDITSFFILALQFRSEHNDIDLAAVNALEDKTINSFVSLTLKLSEGSFRPLFHRIYEWAIKDGDNNQDRIISFFRLSCEVAKALKSLFIFFANDFVDDAADLLTKLSESEIAAESEKQKLLIDSIVKTLYQVFLHDSRGFVNGARFEKLLQPLVDQIENEIVLDSPETMELVSSCLAQLGTAVNDDIQWKQLNYQVLMKSRNNESRIRLFALKVCVDLATKLGEDYMPLLPETVPFIAELLEDDNAEVEKQCQRSVQELEKILGEPLQKYF